MALFNFTAPVDYAVQQSAFEDFLASFKSTATTDALEDPQIDSDGTSDEYDFMDDVVDGQGQQSRRRRDPKRKYMDMLQNVADRKRDHIYIDLDDLDEVRWSLSHSA